MVKTPDFHDGQAPVVYLPTRADYVVLLSVLEPERFLAGVRL